MSQQSILGGGGTFPIQDPPTTAAWIASVNPDTVGNGTGTAWVNQSAVATQFYLDIPNNPMTNTVIPANAKIIQFRLDVNATAGIGNFSRIWIEPTDVNDPTTNAVQNVWFVRPAIGDFEMDYMEIPIGTSQKLGFNTFGTPVAGILTVTLRITGYSI